VCAFFAHPANAAQIQRDLLHHVSSTTADLLLDMSDVGFFGSSGLAVLASADAAVRARGGRMVVVAAPPDVRRTLRVAGLTGTVPVWDVAAEGLGRFTTGAGQKPALTGS
jgi:anti-anti-sigma factor